MSDRTGHEKLLLLCRAITDDTLLHFNRQGESYRLRAFAGLHQGRAPWVQPDAPTASEFLRAYPVEHQVDVAAERVSLANTDRWKAIVVTHNRLFGIGG